MLKTNLNMGDIVFSSTKNNNFHSHIKSNTNLADEFKAQVRNYVKNRSFNILRNFYPSVMINRNNNLIVGGTGGFVLEITVESVCSVIYKHRETVLSLIEREENN